MTVRRLAPRALKVHGRRLSRTLGEATAGVRMRPGFVVVGAQRCGTTSLFRALAAHPLVLPPVFHKGVHFFDVNYHRGPDWYYGHFPVERAARRRTSRRGLPPVTFEASGYYMYHPFAPARMARELPDVRLVMMLRDPVERAYSAHRHELARGFETEPFERALELESTRLEGEVERMAADPRYESHGHRHHSYVRRGEYAGQLARLRALYGADRVLVVESEAFFARPEDEYARVLAFLGLPAFTPAHFDRWNARPRAPMHEDIRRRLSDHFAPHDEALADLLGRRPGWARRRTGTD
jgi:Sulfotransferase domain